MAKARGKRSVNGDLVELMAFTGEAGKPAENPPFVYAESGAGRPRDWSVPNDETEKGAARAEGGDAVKKPSDPLPMVSIRAKAWVIGAMKIRKAATNQTFGQMLEEYVETRLPEEAELAKKMF